MIILIPHNKAHEKGTTALPEDTRHNHIFNKLIQVKKLQFLVQIPKENGVGKRSASAAHIKIHENQGWPKKVKLHEEMANTLKSRVDATVSNKSLSRVSHFSNDTKIKGKCHQLFILIQ